jgi:N-acetylneuraminate epimerase
MKLIPLYLLTITMLFSADIQAQKKDNPVISWKRYSFLQVSRSHPGATGYGGMIAGLHNQKLIIAGGANFPDTMPWLGGKKKYYDSVFILTKKGSHVSLYRKGMCLKEPVAYAAGCTTEKGLFYAGGENENGITNKTWLMTWNETHQQIEINSLPQLPVALTNAAAASSGSLVFVVGGETPAGVSAAFYCLDLSKPEMGWKELAPLPMPVSHAVLFCRKEDQVIRVFIAGGRSKQPNGISTLIHSFMEYDAVKNSWTKKKDLPYALSAGTGVSTPSGSLLLLGGDKGTVFHQVEKLIAEIKVTKEPEKKEELERQKARLQSAHPGFSQQLLRYDENKNEWIPAGKMLYETPVTTVALCWDDCILIPSGEIRAGVRSPYILIGKLSAAYQ